ncbi:MAG TPA: hypothetical protein VEW26_09840, partial [Allosphingosinicella sp.]|nr:hypothetical protein [Allosphingosinicella sp.]
TAVLFGIYAVTALTVVQVFLRANSADPVFMYEPSISTRVAVGVALLLIGVPILFGLATRAIRLRRAVALAQKHIDSKIEFAEQVLTRVTTWESRFKGDYYQKSILKLRVTVLAELLEEMYAISRNYPSRARTLFQI